MKIEPSADYSNDDLNLSIIILKIGKNIENSPVLKIENSYEIPNEEVNLSILFFIKEITIRF